MKPKHNWAITWAIIQSRSWKAQIPYFAEHFRVIAFDPRGNGKSDRPAGLEGYSLDAIIGDVVAVMDATQTKRATLVGMSFSSAIAFAVAAEHPDRVEAVVSTGAWTPIVPPYPERAAAWDAGEIAAPEGWQKYNRHHWRKDYPDFLRFFFDHVHSEPHSTKQREDAVSWGLDGDGEMLTMTQDGRSEPDRITEDTYRRVRCPCLVLVGDADLITPPQASHRIAELTGAELVVRPGGGHEIHARYPAWFNTVIFRGSAVVKTCAPSSAMTTDERPASCPSAAPVSGQP